MSRAVCMKLGESLFGACKAYLPEEHWDLFSFSEEYGVAFRASHPMMHMYGGGEELMEAIEKFRNIPGGHSFFGGALTEKNSSQEKLYPSISGKAYMFKQDIYHYLQNIVMFSNISSNNEILPMICYYLRVKEQDLRKICELALFDEEKLDEFKKKLVRELTTFTKTIEFKENEKNLAGVFNKFKEILPKHDDDPEYEVIHTILKGYVKNKTVKRYARFYEDWLNRVAVNIRVLDAFIEENPQWFRLTDKGPAIVRVIYDEDKLVMTHELLSQMKKADLNYKTIENEVINSPKLSTWNLETVKEKVGDDYGKIEFILAKIERTRHRAVYIPTIDGTYCIPAIDVVIEALHDIISVKSLFQHVPEDKEQLMRGICLGSITLITGMFGNTRFISLEDVAEISKSRLTICRKRIPEILAKKKEIVHKISNKGFTAKDLENELERFGVTKVFPDVLQFHKSYFDLLKMDHDTERLRTCDMYEVLERCITAAIFVYSKKMQNFYHANLSCRSRLLIECPVCIEETDAKEAAERNASSSDSSVADLTKKMESTSTME
ncbi:hypothetical protein CAEBREN_13097 [Caenorhabditis brenneri]|uniref:DUF7809 domain-containing protein n=1 Tax=Caenorhabditis brenneri TaxID=135651 RepID=G0NHU5_CAEBE|nr:hypothetical protein CAEBREN_13097 [Caenorhabditis brenneri]